MSTVIQSYLSKTDFFLTIICLLIVLLKSCMLKKHITLNKFIILDWLALSFSIFDIVYCLVTKIDVMNPTL